MFSQDVPNTMSLSLDDPPNSRLFVVAGKNTSSDFLRSVFEQYGQVSFVKYLRDKGVAYVKYERASSAALAIENLHEVTLNDGHGPRLKVMLAESPHSRSVPASHVNQPDDTASLDPDNTPPRSRLFLVVPKNADGSIIEAEMARFAGMQYCKTDLIASKGIAFVKYTTSSVACMAMESVQASGTVAGYKVKIMLAEPKSRRSESNAQGFLHGLSGPSQGRQMIGPGTFGGNNGTGGLIPSLSPGLLGPGMGIQEFSTLGALGGSQGPFGITSLMGGSMHGPLDMGPTPSPLDSHLNNLGSLNSNDYMKLGGPLGLSSPMLAAAGLLAPPSNHLAPSSSAHLGTDSGNASSNSLQNGSYSQNQGVEGVPNTRLFIVVHKSATEDALAALFRCYVGMEYLDLKRDRITGRSKGYAYVNYITLASACTAQAQLNGIEYPPGTGSRLKVLFAEPMTHSTNHYNSNDNPNSAPSSRDHILLGTPSQVDAAATVFHLSNSSNNSRDSVLGLGQSALAAAAAQQAQQQLSARTDLSSTSHESMLSPHSSPLRLSTGTISVGGAVAGVSGAAVLVPEASLGVSGLSSAGEIAAGMGGLTLRDAVNGHQSHSPGKPAINFSPVPGGAAVSPQTSLSDASGGSVTHDQPMPGTWREPTPDNYSSGTSVPLIGRLP